MPTAAIDRASLVLEAFDLHAMQARDVLATDSGSRSDVFGSVEVALDLPPRYLRLSNGVGGQLMKSYAAGDALTARGSDCIVYGIGVADTLLWEADMARRHGCQVFAFDCTSDAAARTAEAAAAGVKFFPWCVGTKQSFEGNSYAKKASEAEYEFRSLRDIMSALGHTRLDVLKLDIEGFEWRVLRDELLPLAAAAAAAPATDDKKSAAPLQLLFELHTAGANPYFVPPRLVAGKGREEVNELFLSLLDVGYRVVAKDINEGDAACAEFALVRL
jgi:FkbM family methyltransferase